MKKIVIGLLVITAMVMGQEAAGSGSLAFGKSSKHLGVGINLYTGWNTWNAALGISTAFDVGAINDMISFGGDFTFYTDSWNTFGNNWRNNGIAIFFRAGFHPFGIPALAGKIKVADKMDPYVLLKPGVDIVFYDDNFTTVNDADANFRFLAAMGIRYYFTDNFGVWSEFDWDNLIGGVTFKF